MGTKIKATRREVSQPSELQKGAIKRELPKKYNKLSIREALDAAKQHLTALAIHLRRYTTEAKARRIDRMFSTEPSLPSIISVAG